MSKEKNNFEASAAAHRATSEALAQQAHTAGSETMKHNLYNEAQKELNIAETLDNCAKALKE